MLKEDIREISVRIRAGSGTERSVRLCADGTVEREGFVGRTDQPWFQIALTRVEEPLLDRHGTYRLWEQDGTPCSLQLEFLAGSGASVQIEVIHGSAVRPPMEVHALVSALLKLTDDWLRARQRETSR